MIRFTILFIVFSCLGITQVQMVAIEKKFNEYDSIIAKQVELNEVQSKLNDQLIQRIIKLTGGKDD